MEKKTSSQPKLQEDRSTALIKAAFDVFSTEGYAAARMEDIAIRAGVTKGLIYFYYKNKLELFEAVIGEYVKKPLHGIILDVDPAQSMASHLVRILDDLYNKQLVSPFMSKMIRLILMEGHRFPQVQTYYFNEIMQSTMKIIHECLNEGRRRGEWTQEAVPQFIQIIMAPCIVFALWKVEFAKYNAIDTMQYAKEHQESLLRSLGLTPTAVEDALAAARRMRPSVPAATQKCERPVSKVQASLFSAQVAQSPIVRQDEDPRSAPLMHPVGRRTASKARAALRKRRPSR